MNYFAFKIVFFKNSLISFSEAIGRGVTVDHSNLFVFPCNSYSSNLLIRQKPPDWYESHKRSFDAAANFIAWFASPGVRTQPELKGFPGSAISPNCLFSPPGNSLTLEMTLNETQDSLTRFISSFERFCSFADSSDIASWGEKKIRDAKSGTVLINDISFFIIAKLYHRSVLITLWKITAIPL